MAPLVVIVGETASGKSALALELAKKFGGEIICADSWTVRREVNIGTAKPGPKERAEIPHHLLDIVGPDDDFTAAVFKKLANQAINDITKRGKLPIMVGGTGLYIDGVIYNYGFLPRGNRQKRQELNGLTVEELLSRIQAEKLDYTGVDVRNKRRLIRILETGGAKPQKQDLRPDTLVIGIRHSKEETAQHIKERVSDMFEHGLEGEVRALAEKYGWDCEALKGIGYREWRAYFEGRQSLDETRQRIIKSTLDLAKRQRTWFKRNSSIHWINDPEQAVELITALLNKKP